MFAKKNKSQSAYNHLLQFMILLVFLMIIIGGLTRLTNSGLSITEWELFKGILPPLQTTLGTFTLTYIKKYPSLNF